MLVTRGGLAVKRKCTDGDSFRMRLLAAAYAVNVLHIAAVADTYYWLPERGVKADASNLSNWSIEFDSEAKAPVADAHPTRMPTASDELCAARDFHFDFNGESLAFKSMNAAAISPYTGITYWGGPGEGWTFENGSLSVENLTQRIRTGDSMLLTNGMHLTCSRLFSPGNGMGPDGICDIDIADGCALVAAKTAFANGHIHVAEGGSFSTELLQNSGAQNSCVLENRGLTEFGRIDIASTAPAAPSVWPVVPLTEHTGTLRPASSPHSARSALDSVSSLACVPVPCALTYWMSFAERCAIAKASVIARYAPSPFSEDAV